MTPTYMKPLINQIASSLIMEDVFSGLLGGIAGTVVGHPMDTIKGRLQTQGVSGRTISYRGPYHCFVDICRTEGVRALYKGLVPPLLGYSAMNALVFGVYGYSMAIIQPDGSSRPKPSSIVLASTIASLAQTPFNSITELVKLRLQTQGIREAYHTHVFGGKGNAYGPWRILWLLYQRDGIKGFGKGMGTAFIRDVIGFVSYFLTYEILCQVFAGDKKLNQLPAAQLILSGGIAGMVTWTSCYPLDVVKSRLQTDGIGMKPEYNGMVDCFKKSYSSGGWRVFYQGLGVTLFRAFPVNAATFYTVTSTLKIFRKDNREYSVL